MRHRGRPADQSNIDRDASFALLALLLVASVYLLLREGGRRRYIRTALRHAEFEWLGEDKIWYGQIPGLQGVWASASTREGCRAELEEILDEWVQLRRAQGLGLPAPRGSNVVAA